MDQGSDFHLREEGPRRSCIRRGGFRLTAAPERASSQAVSSTSRWVTSLHTACACCTVSA